MRNGFSSRLGQAVNSLAFLFAPQQLMGLAEGLLRGAFPRPSTLYLFFPLERTRKQYAARAMLATLAELKPIIAPSRIVRVPTISGMRSLQIAWFVRRSTQGTTNSTALISGLPTYGLMERSRLISSGDQWILLDDGLSSNSPSHHLYDKTQGRRGGSMYGALVGAVAGPWPRELPGEIDLFTTFPVLEQDLVSIPGTVSVVRHEFEWLASHYQRAPTMDSTVPKSATLVGTNLRGVPDSEVIRVVVEIIKRLGLDTYRPHRHEPTRRTRQIAERTGVRLSPSTLPLELCILKSSNQENYVLMPGSTWYTVPKLLPLSRQPILLRISTLFGSISCGSASGQEVVALLKSIEDEYPSNATPSPVDLP